MSPPFDFRPPNAVRFLQMSSNVDSRVEAVEATSSEEPYFAQSPFGYQVNIPYTELKDKFCSRKPISNTSELHKRRMVTDSPCGASQAADADDGDKISRAELEAAVRQATENAERKAKVQIMMKDLFKTKVDVIKKAVLETPDKSIKEVWAVADKARPPPAVPKVAQLTSATPAAINGLALSVPSSSDLQRATVNSPAIESTTNPILQRMKVNVFVTTPHDCDGTVATASIEDEDHFLRAARNLEAFPSFPGVPIKHRVKGWPAGPKNQEATTEPPSGSSETQDTTPIYSVESPFSNELEGAKMLASAAVWRYMTPTRQHIDIIIRVTHGVPGTEYRHEQLHAVLSKHVNDLQTRIMDWLEVRLYRFVDQTGGREVWKGATKKERCTAYKAALKQFPVSIFTGLLGAETAAHLDLGSIWSNHGDIDLTRQEHCVCMFLQLCEIVYLYIIAPLTEGVSESFMTTMRTGYWKAVKTMVYVQPLLVALTPRLGGLGDIPFLGFRGGSEDNDVAALMISRIAGAESNVSKLFAPPSAGTPGTATGMKRKHDQIL
ncbi:unnamed protein product [Zymoseptoria tritici ST99CH_3D7]|uniref:Uncharacterized protein n=1 Tax=Zymoseptoria tritici (strain ST99CH_3D7) TaxID=1276538 RepID=A0A1X7RT30_ZYMT9|nr:unnamed protein product [Zymoseptoria tritici ST99CH_3D7]